MTIFEKKIKLGVIVGTRGFFSSELISGVRRDLLAQIEKAGFEAVILPEDATPNGAVETLADADKYAALFRKENVELDGLIVSLPNFGDELGIVETIMRSKLDVGWIGSVRKMSDFTDVSAETLENRYCAYNVSADGNGKAGRSDASIYFHPSANPLPHPRSQSYADVHF